MQFDINRIAEMISEFHSHAFMLTSFCDFKRKEDENKFEREYKEQIIAQLSLALKNSKLLSAIFSFSEENIFFYRTSGLPMRKKG